MSKNVVVCCDGTANEFAKHNTNVVKLYSVLRHDPATQVTYYHPGLGTMEPAGALTTVARRVTKLLGMAFGYGLPNDVRDAYVFLMGHFEPGDRVFLFGFSRGAYTVRALAGLIAARGLIDAQAQDLTDKNEAYAMGATVWFDYRREALTARGIGIGSIQEVAAELSGFVDRRPLPKLTKGVTIDTVAVWDTVGALGLPKFNRNFKRADVFEFVDTKLSPVVRRGVHAVALDEQRADFTPTLWAADARVTQVLFPGAHSDVGGGYPGTECGLSDGALQWMTTQLTDIGVRFAPSPRFVPAPDPCGIAHEPWKHPPVLADTRTFTEPVTVHSSVRERTKCASVVFDPGTLPRPYAPANLP